MNKKNNKIPIKNAVFILPAPYIIKDDLNSILNLSDADRFMFFIPKLDNTFNEMFYDKSFLSTFFKKKISIIKILNYELKPSLTSFKEVKSEIDTSLNKIDNIIEVYLQSLEPFFSRYILSEIKKHHKDFKTIGLQLSLPVFLFRNKKFLESNLKKSHFKLTLMSGIEDHKVHRPKLFSIKLFFKNVIDKLLHISILNFSRFDFNFVKNTSYLPKGYASCHYTNDKYYKRLLIELYNETVFEISEINKSCQLNDNKKIKNNSNNFISSNLVVLGPTSKKMCYDYLSDIKYLFKFYNFKNCIIRPHPRFEKETNFFLGILKQETFFKNFVIGPGCLKSDCLLGYFSSLLVQVPKSKQRKVFVSKRASKQRYPTCSVELLSGQLLGYKRNLTLLPLK